MIFVLAFLKANLATVLVGLALVLLLSAVILYLIRAKKKGKSSCSCGCGGCPMKDSCHSGKKDASSDES